MRLLGGWHIGTKQAFGSKRLKEFLGNWRFRHDALSVEVVVRGEDQPPSALHLCMDNVAILAEHVCAC